MIIYLIFNQDMLIIVDLLSMLFTGHPWIGNYKDVKVPLDILIFRLMKAYMRSSSLRKAALRVSLWWIHIFF